MIISNLNPQLPYYLMLFMLTIILRCIRAYRSKPKHDVDRVAFTKYVSGYFYFGFELVNVSAGVFILLSEHASKYVGSLMILYVILVILSFFFEDEGVGLKVKTVGHILVSTVVIAVTVYAFTSVNGLKPCKTEISSTNNKWQVALPYMDTTLNRNFGTKNIAIKKKYCY